jgi:hypothetical protein
MSKAMAFVAGFVCSILLFSGGHPAPNGVTVEAAAQDLDPVSAFWGPGFAASIPRVPPLPSGSQTGMLVSGMPQSLDGLNCRNCKFVNSDLIYAGGPLHLEDIAVSGTTHITLQGAAANTLALLTFFNAIQEGVPATPNVPQQPIKKTSIAKKPMTELNFSPPFIGQR